MRKLTKKQAGQKGGKSTFSKYGPEHMREIGRRGAVAMHAKYKLEPWGLNDFALVERETNVIKTWMFGRPF